MNETLQILEVVTLIPICIDLYYKLLHAICIFRYHAHVAKSSPTICLRNFRYATKFCTHPHMIDRMCAAAFSPQASRHLDLQLHPDLRSLHKTDHILLIR